MAPPRPGPAVSSPLLTVEGLTKSYRGVPAVQDLSFAVAAGSVTGLIGPNGSGKSTTIDCLSGSQRPDAGAWRLNGRPLAGLPLHELAQAGLIRTFQAVRVYETLTVTDNLRIAAQAFDGTGWADHLLRTARWRASEAAAGERAGALLELVGLTTHAGSLAGVLSYGQRKLLQICAAMMGRPRLIMLDEPVAGVNPTMVRHIEEVVRRLQAEGVTLLIVEHNVEFIMRLCDRVVVLDLGRKIAEGPPALIREDPRVLAAYIGTGRKRAVPA